jgi:2-isopropylmalate synthase
VFISTVADPHGGHAADVAQQVLDGIAEGVKLAAGYTDDVEFSARTPPDGARLPARVLRRRGRRPVRTTINVPDTVGYATPAEFGELVRIVRDRTPTT